MRILISLLILSGWFQQPSPQTILFWHPYANDPEPTVIDRLIKEFNASNPWGIEVVGVAYENYHALFQTMSTTSPAERPHLVMGTPVNAAAYIDSGIAADLNPFFDDPVWGFSEADRAHLDAEILDLWRRDDGLQMGLPFQISTQLLAVNMSLLAKLGFENPPQTLGEFQQIACAASQRDGLKGYPIKGDATEFETFLAGHGGEILSDGQYTFTTPEAIATLEFYAALYRDGCAYFPDEPLGETVDFGAEQTPFILTTTIGFQFLESEMEEDHLFQWTLTLPPSADGQGVMQVFAPGILLLKSTPEAELAAWLFMKYLTEAVPQAEWAAHTPYFPLDRDVTSPGGSLQDTTNRYLHSPAVRLYLSPPQSSYGLVRALISQAIDDVTIGGKDVLIVAHELETAANTTHQELAQ